MKWLKFWNWPKEAAKKYAWKFIDEKWESYEKEAVKWVEDNAGKDLKQLSDKWQAAAKEWLDKL